MYRGSFSNLPSLFYSWISPHYNTPLPLSSFLLILYNNTHICRPTCICICVFSVYALTQHEIKFSTELFFFFTHTIALFPYKLISHFHFSLQKYFLPQYPFNTLKPITICTDLYWIYSLDILRLFSHPRRLIIRRVYCTLCLFFKHQ